MAAPAIDWRVMRGAIILFSVAVVIGGTLVGAAEWFQAEVTARYEQQKKLLAGVRSSYQQVDEEEAIMTEYLPLYREYEAAGIIGDERRLTWVESLRGVAAGLDLPSLRYEIGQREEFVPDLPLEAGRHRIHRTEMSLDMGLFHEGDLPRVLQALERGAEGLFSVQACELRRERPLFEMDPRQPNASAACKLRWYSLQAPDA